MIKFRINKFRFTVSIFIILTIISVASVLIKNNLSVSLNNKPVSAEAEVINKDNDIDQKNAANSERT